MSELSQTKNTTGFKYRKGQAATIQMILNGGRGTYLANLPGGYGKTLTALGAYYQLREKREVNRFLYIAPTSAKLFEFKHDIKKQAEKIGMNFISSSGDNAVTVNDAFAIQEHRYNTHEFFMVTPHFGINKRGSILTTLLSSGDWFVCVDESHHYTDQNKFGELVEGLNARYFLGLSATPDNHTQLAIFSKLSESHVYRVSIPDAIIEGAIRPIEYECGEYFVDVDIEGSIVRLTTSELQDEMEANNAKDLNAFEVKRQLRYLAKYTNPLFVRAIDKYFELIERDTYEYMQNYGKQPYRPIHQMLVFADTVSIAKNYVNLINSIVNDSTFADWIGTGIEGRKTEENNAVLQKYKEGQLPCLVQVSIAGEGFDNPQSSIIVYLSLQYQGNQVVQKIMRGMRRNYMIDDTEKDLGYIYVPSDSKALSTIDALSKLTWEHIPEHLNTEKKQRQENQMDVFQLPLFDMDKFNTIEDVNIKDWVYNAIPENLYKRIEQGVMQQQTRTGVIYDINSKEYDNKLRAIVIDIMGEKFEQQEQEMTRKNLQDKIKNLVGTIARRIVLKNHGNQSINTTLIGDYIRAIHSRYKYENGISTKEMTYQQLKAKIEWVNNLANNVNETQKLPIWLQI